MINKKLVGLLLSKGLTISTAESCTGGLVAKAITDIGGCSEIYMGGIVAYSNDVKIRVLGVSPSTLDIHGAVSEQTAKEMAEGVRTLCRTDIGISTTGIAGPGGGTEKKPVGTVYVGFSINEECFAFNLNLDRSMSRDEIRRTTVDRILNILYDKIFQSY